MVENVFESQRQITSEWQILSLPRIPSVSYNNKYISSIQYIASSQLAKKIVVKMDYLLTAFRESKYSGGLRRADKAASWKGAGAESVILTWIFLIADAMVVGAQAQPILQPVRFINGKKKKNRILE